MVQRMVETVYWHEKVDLVEEYGRGQAWVQQRMWVGQCGPGRGQVKVVKLEQRQ
jgi:hypothetical protein